MRERKYTEPTLTQPRPLQRARVHERRPEDLRPIFTMQDFLREGLYYDTYPESDWIPARDYREVIIEGPVDPKHIETLQKQKIEIELAIAEGPVVAKTGTAHQCEANSLPREEIKAHLHTHPRRHDYINDYPSIDDLGLAGGITKERGDKKSPRFFIAHFDGITEYQAPIIDPTTKEAIADPDIFSQSRFLHYMFISFIQKEKGITDIRQAVLYFEDLGTEDRAYFFKKFAQESRSIVAQASWSDKDAIKKMLEPFNTRQ